MSRIVESLYRVSGIELNEDFDFLALNDLTTSQLEDLEHMLYLFISKRLNLNCIEEIHIMPKYQILYIELNKETDDWYKLENTNDIASIFKNLESSISNVLKAKVTYDEISFDDDEEMEIAYTITELEAEVTPLIKALEEHCIENWKEHADAPVPKSNPEEINVYDFDEDEYEPLRPKWYDCKPVAGGLYIYWVGQEDGYISDGMYNEIERWAKTIRDKYCKGEHTKIFLKTENRDGTESDEAVIEI